VGGMRVSWLDFKARNPHVDSIPGPDRHRRPGREQLTAVQDVAAFRTIERSLLWKFGGNRRRASERRRLARSHEEIACDIKKGDPAIKRASRAGIYITELPEPDFRPGVKDRMNVVFERS
jgi:hypothetical protein